MIARVLIPMIFYFGSISIIRLFTRLPYNLRSVFTRVRIWVGMERVRVLGWGYWRLILPIVCMGVVLSDGWAGVIDGRFFSFRFSTRNYDPWVA